jgi:hypothetical protein
MVTPSDGRGLWPPPDAGEPLFWVSLERNTDSFSSGFIRTPRSNCTRRQGGTRASSAPAPRSVPRSLHALCLSYPVQARGFSIGFAIEFKECVLVFVSLDNLFQVSDRIFDVRVLRIW